MRPGPIVDDLMTLVTGDPGVGPGRHWVLPRPTAAARDDGLSRHYYGDIVVVIIGDPIVIDDN